MNFPSFKTSNSKNLRTVIVPTKIEEPQKIEEQKTEPQITEEQKRMEELKTSLPGYLFYNLCK